MSAPTTDFDLGRIRDLAGRSWHPWTRRIILLLMLALVVLGLTGMLGQVERTETASSSAALVKVRRPEALRGGLNWPADVRIEAHRRITAPVVVLSEGFIRGMQLNSIEPSPTSERSRGTGLAFSFPTLEPGQSLDLHLQLQVNPTTVGKQDLGVRVESPDMDPLVLPKTVTVLP